MGFWNNIGAWLGIITPSSAPPLPDIPAVAPLPAPTVLPVDPVPVPPVVVPASTAGANLTALKALIMHSEGTSRPQGKQQGFSPYDISIGYGKWWPPTFHDKVSQQNLRDARTLGKLLVAHGAPSTALGAYQIINTTRDECQQALRLSDDTIFNASVQDKMFYKLLEKRGFAQWHAGAMTTAEFLDQLAYEWASLPNSRGVSQYKQPLGCTVQNVLDALNASI